jgi:hypothetical protein
MPLAIQSNAISRRHRTGRIFYVNTFRVVLISLFSFTGTAHSFENLTSAQNLVYGTAHLSNTVAGQQINYRYSSQVAMGDIIIDRVSLSIKETHKDNRRDVVLDFLSAERHMPLPDFDDFRGNPVIVAMLEHIAQSFGRETGGGALYFRNRIRDGLAKKSTQIEQITVGYSDTTIGATRVLFSPFAGDVYLVEKPEYTQANFTITLSEDVPGGVVGIAVKSSQNDITYFKREIVIE